MMPLLLSLFSSATGPPSASAPGTDEPAPDGRDAADFGATLAAWMGEAVSPERPPSEGKPSVEEPARQQPAEAASVAPGPHRRMMNPARQEHAPALLSAGVSGMERVGARTVEVTPVEARTADTAATIVAAPDSAPAGTAPATTEPAVREGTSHVPASDPRVPLAAVTPEAVEAGSSPASDPPAASGAALKQASAPSADPSTSRGAAQPLPSPEGPSGPQGEAPRVDTPSTPPESTPSARAAEPAPSPPTAPRPTAPTIPTGASPTVALPTSGSGADAEATGSSDPETPSPSGAAPRLPDGVRVRAASGGLDRAGTAPPAPQPQLDPAAGRVLETAPEAGQERPPAADPAAPPATEAEVLPGTEAKPASPALRPMPDEDRPALQTRSETDPASSPGIDRKGPGAVSTDLHDGADHPGHDPSDDTDTLEADLGAHTGEDALAERPKVLNDGGPPEGAAPERAPTAEPIGRADGPVPGTETTTAKTAPATALKSAAPAPWLATLAPLLDALPTPTPEASLDVDLGDDGTLSIRARREDGRLAVVVHLSDPSVRATARGEADAIRDRLEQHYGAAVDLSFSQDGGRESHRAFQDAHAFTPRSAPSPARPSPAPSGAPRRGWVG